MVSTRLEEHGTGSAEELCRSCGLCCDGTFFHQVLLAKDEAVPHGMQVVQADQSQAFTQRCSQFDKVCQIYLSRPQACRKFESASLAEYKAGRLTIQQVKARIAKVTAKRDELISRFGMDPAYFYGTISTYLQASKENPEFNRENKDLMLQIGAFLLMRKHFVRQGDKS